MEAAGGINGFLMRLAVDRRLQYRTLLAVGFPILIGVSFAESLPAADIIQGALALVFLPLFVHRVVRPSWHPNTLEGRLKKIAWRMGLEERAGGDGIRWSFGGDFLEDPALLETYLPPSFSIIENDTTSEVWSSPELHAVLRRDGLTVRLVAAENEGAFDLLLATARTRPLLP